MVLKIIDSPFVDVYQNLAMEEYLLNSIESETIILYLWQNADTVVLGQNQNPYLQCNIEYINEQKIKIARRLSGGGTVFHDQGNLNYTIISDEKNFDKKRNFMLLLSALRSLEIQAEQSGRNDITAGNSKISGTAFYSNGKVCLQHGCILINTNLEKMFLCLKVKKDKIIGKDIDSVHARVINISAINPHITIERLRLAIQAEFYKAYSEHTNLSAIDITVSKPYQELVQKYSSWEWNMGKQLNSKTILYDRFLWGDCSLIFEVEGGYIKDVGIYTDALETDIFHKIENALCNIRFSRQEILKALDSLVNKTNFVSDIKRMIQNEKQLLES